MLHRSIIQMYTGTCIKFGGKKSMCSSCLIHKYEWIYTKINRNLVQREIIISIYFYYIHCMYADGQLPASAIS